MDAGKRRFQDDFALSPVLIRKSVSGTSADTSEFDKLDSNAVRL
jgi:hypothetical protein